MKNFTLSLLLLASAVGLAGCGAGSGGSNSVGAVSGASRGVGRATITLKWPVRTVSRLIPNAANRVVVTMKKNGVVYGSPVTMDRPLSGSYVTSQTVDNLPTGDYTADAAAYPDTNPASIAQAKILNQSFTVVDGQTANLNLTMASAIASLVVSGAGGATSLAPAATLQVSAVAKDAANSAVLTSGTITYSSNATGVATVNATTGLVTGVAAGTARITATDSESGVSGFVDVTVQAPLSGIFVASIGTSSIANFQDLSGTGWTTLGSSGTGVNQFRYPMGMARDSQGRIYITDNQNNRIVRINDMTGTGWTALVSDGTHTFLNPTGIAIDSQDRIYVANAGNPTRIARINDITGAGWVEYGSFGVGTGQFGTPYGIAVDSTFHIYVADTDNNRIVKINDMTGAGWTALTTCGGVAFLTPSGVAVDGSGHIYIADFNNNRICCAANITDATGAAYGVSGSGVGQFSGPWGITLSSSGAIYVADRFNSRVVKMTNMTGAGWATFGSAGSGTNQFSQPFGILVN